MLEDVMAIFDLRLIALLLKRLEDTLAFIRYFSKHKTSFTFYRGILPRHPTEASTKAAMTFSIA